MKFRKMISAFLAGIMIFMPASYVSAEWIKNSEIHNQASDEEETAPEEDIAEQYSNEYNFFDSVTELISEMYIDETLTKEDIAAKGLSELLKNNSPLLIELLKSTLGSLDDYSQFFTFDEYVDYQDSTNNTFYGVGINLEEKEDGVYISGFSDDGDAKNAGLMVGDRITAVDDNDVQGWTLEKIRNLVLGEAGTKVNITVQRGGESLSFSVIRQVAIDKGTVSGVMTSGILAGNIGHVKISSFGSDTDEEFMATLEQLRENNVKKLILDLRNNPGGYVESAINIAKVLVPKGKIIDVVSRSNLPDITYSSDLENPEFEIIVLVNENTASAAEILASAIQDSGAGKLLGKKTFGKAVIQRSFPIVNGTVLHFTIAQYLTRNGKKINGIGLFPDEEVDNKLSTVDTSQYTKFDYSTRYVVGQSGEGVKAAKEKLYMLGLYKATTNNTLYTKELQDSVKTFQQSHDLVPSGIIDIATQVAIDEEFSKLEVMEDVQLERAYEIFGGNSGNLY